VKSNETVIFAVFTTTDVNAQGQLTARSFNNNHLRSFNQSLARRSFVTLPIFHSKIVCPAASPLRGIALANAGRIRGLVADIKLNAGQQTVRAFCLLDRVEQSDCEGHATVGYSETHETFGVSPEQLGKIRGKIRLDLANTFSQVGGVTSCRWARMSHLLIGRFLSIVRTLFHANRST
jgi:hypothetical protein